MIKPLCLFLYAICTCTFFPLLMMACAIVPQPTESLHFGENNELGNCAEFFAALDRRLSAAQELDPGAFRVEGYPYLRVNRFLASFREEVEDKEAFSAWVDQMQSIDRESRQFEIANLVQTAESSASSSNDLVQIIAKLQSCGDLLKKADFQNKGQQTQLRRRVSAPDEYLSLPRILGLYPISSLFVSNRVSKWHAEVLRTFSTEPAVGWRTIRYAPKESGDLLDAGQIVSQVKRDALGIPNYSPTAQAALFQIYAPIWEIQLEGEYDRIGSPFWDVNNELAINTQMPFTYTLISFTRFENQILTQLNYIVWFPSRPKEKAWDIYGGQLDGVNYRVTLDKNGQPLLYETIHNCGCYYKAYPNQRLKVRGKIDYAEPPLILKAPEIKPSTELMTVSMESRTHYVQHLYPLRRKLQPDTVIYSFADYGELRSLSESKGDRKSMFSQNSLASGSERLERFILWPTGVVSPGAMRQWGRHAVAFVGKRHFDDPFALGKMFTYSVSE